MKPYNLIKKSISIRKLVVSVLLLTIASHAYCKTPCKPDTAKSSCKKLTKAKSHPPQTTQESESPHQLSMMERQAEIYYNNQHGAMFP
jgi:hypothetical protein